MNRLFLRVNADEQAVKRIVRQWGEYYYVVLMNTRDNGLTGTDTVAQVQQGFTAVNSLKMFIPDSTIIDSGEELLSYAGQSDRAVTLRQEPFVASLGRARQSLGVSLPAAGVSIYRFHIRQNRKITVAQTAAQYQSPPPNPAISSLPKINAKEIQETDSLPILSIAPNPASDVVNIQYHLQETLKGSIIIADSRGVPIVGIEEHTLQKGTHTIPLNVQSLPAGMYTCLLYANGRMTSSQFLIVR